MKPNKLFDFKPGENLLEKYKILDHLGTGWEGDVFLIKETKTGIERAAKFFLPKRNKNNSTLKFYAKKLYKLRHCSLVIQYHTQEFILLNNKTVPFLVSEFVEGELLSDFIKRQPGKRMNTFQALHLLHALTSGLEEIHRLKEYHGDIHSENIIVQRYGLGFDLKLIDFFQWRTHSNPENIQDDIYDIINLFYEALGGSQWYSKHPQIIKDICLGKRRELIKKKFRNATKLKDYLENIEWE